MKKPEKCYKLKHGKAIMGLRTATPEEIILHIKEWSDAGYRVLHVTSKDGTPLRHNGVLTIGF